MFFYQWKFSKGDRADSNVRMYITYRIDWYTFHVVCEQVNTAHASVQTDVSSRSMMLTA